MLSSADPADENTLDEPRKVAPVEKTLEVHGTNLQETFPGNSVTVIRIVQPVGRDPVPTNAPVR